MKRSAEGAQVVLGQGRLPCDVAEIKEGVERFCDVNRYKSFNSGNVDLYYVSAISEQKTVVSVPSSTLLNRRLSTVGICILL